MDVMCGGALEMLELLFKLLLMEVLLVVEEHFRGLEEWSASDVSSDNTSKNSETESDTKCGKLVASLLTGGSSALSINEDTVSTSIVSSEVSASSGTGNS
jgi:hypothetical protein